MIEEWKWMSAVVLAVGVCTGVQALDVTRAKDTVVFGTEAFRIVLDSTTGAPVRLEADGRPVAESPGDRQYFDIRQDGTWVTGGTKAEARLLTAERAGDDTLTATVDVGAWRVVFRYELIPVRRRLRRSVELEWRGDGDTKLKGFWMDLPGIPREAVSAVCAPGAYPPLALEPNAGIPDPGRKQSSSRGPQLLILEGDWTWVLAHDQLTPLSDNGDVSVTGEADRLRLTQGFQSFARMKPGDRQEIQAGWTWLLPKDAEPIDHAVPGLLESIGHRVPADRPEWVKQAVLYSFHPGGTIGSRFSDLGGFAPATEFLAEIADLGCNAVWIMPIEDVSVYHPRDYYKFQQGLGTGDEYRALVRKAHGLGMKLIQDIVPHGGSDTFPRAKEHPEWLAQEEDGSTLSYWCFDFNWPGWRDYMADVARHYVTQYDVDGYRVDACAGSKIPNWNPDIPYGRASFAKLQGGLNMLRGLRSAVKESKPDVGGLLAETQGSVYGTVSDAVYDFTYCYGVLQDIRKSPADVFTHRLRWWLRNQQLGETPDLLRLRHIESHDSLRSLLWYGLEPQRALMALSSWIHGMPLVYHEMEEGSSDVFRRIFAIRRRLPELNGGEADYLSVDAPCFACLRSSGDSASVVVVNLSNARVKGNATVLSPVVHPKVAWDMWRGCEVRTSAGADGLRIPLALPPFGFTVFALRNDPAEHVEVAPDPWATESVPQSLPVASGQLELVAGQLRLTVDAATGFPASVRVGDALLAGAADLYLPDSFIRAAGPVAIERTPLEIVARRPFGGSSLAMRYRAMGDRIRVTAMWEGNRPDGDCALAIPFESAERWYASAGEGLFEDRYRCRHMTGEGALASIYWRPQGTNAVWDSLLHPFGVVAGSASCGARTQGHNVTLSFEDGAPPDRFRWLDRIHDDHRLTALIAWQDSECISLTNDAPIQFDISVTPPPSCERYADGGEWSIRPAAGGWEFRNAHYQLRLSRSGVIAGYGPVAGGEEFIRDCDLYTDGGFGKDRTRYSAANDVEAASRIWRDGNTLRLQFAGRVRGTYRFDTLDPPVSYVTSYTLGSSPGFGLSIAVKPDAPPKGRFAFLSSMFRVPSMARVRFLAGGRELGAAHVGDGKSRILETKQMAPPTMPDTIEIARTDGNALLRFSQLAVAGPRTPGNVFVHGQNLFIAWQDGPPDADGTGEWQSIRMIVSVAGPKESTLQALVPLSSDGPGADSLLQDSGFELGGQCKPRSVRTGHALPGIVPGSVWRSPPGGQIVSTDAHSGHAAAEVVGAQNEYRLWRQAVPLGGIPTGSRWRLSAWVKGQDLVRGDVSWKVGTVRFAVTTDRTQYVSCPELLGVFDWKRVSVELVVPEALQSLEVQAGPNGCTGTIWIDDVTLEHAGE